MQWINAHFEELKSFLCCNGTSEQFRMVQFDTYTRLKINMTLPCKSLMVSQTSVTMQGLQLQKNHVI